MTSAYYCNMGDIILTSAYYCKMGDIILTSAYYCSYLLNMLRIVN